MAAVRRNVADAPARRRFVEGVLGLKAERLSTTTVDLGITGPARRVST
jgi:extradiol dioxygenase family protein